MRQERKEEKKTYIYTVMYWNMCDLIVVVKKNGERCFIH